MMTGNQNIMAYHPIHGTVSQSQNIHPSQMQFQTYPRPIYQPGQAGINQFYQQTCIPQPSKFQTVMKGIKNFLKTFIMTIISTGMILLMLVYQIEVLKIITKLTGGI